MLGLPPSEDAEIKKAGNVSRQPSARRVLSLLKSRWALLLGLVALLGILLAFSDVRQPLSGLLSAALQGDSPTIRDTLRAYGPLAPAVSIALILLHAVVPLPAEILAFANGLAFGFWGGLAVTWSGFMLSALSIYAIGRLWGRSLLERTVPQRYRERLDGWLEREGAFPLLAVRLVPLAPFNAVCLTAGAVRAPLWTYAWTTGVGILPLGITVSFLGSRMGESEPHLGASFWALSSVFLLTILIAWLIARRRTRG
jgi:uncharacterized membrane protein YdjX (TVP38/TMEM64 family)